MSLGLARCHRAGVLIEHWQRLRDTTHGLVRCVALQGSNARQRLLDDLHPLESAVRNLVERIEYTDIPEVPVPESWNPVSVSEYLVACDEIRRRARRCEDLATRVRGLPLNAAQRVIAEAEGRDVRNP